MQNLFLIIQIAISAFLIGLILVQARGKGLSSAWGGSISSFTRRGLERLIFRLTFLISALFIVFSLFQILI